MSNPSSVPSPGASQGMSTKPTGGNSAAKVFKEFKWGLLTLFLLMAVVIGLVYDGGKKKVNTAGAKPTTSENTGSLADNGMPPATDPLTGNPGMPGVSSNPGAGMPGNGAPSYAGESVPLGNDPYGAVPGNNVASNGGRSNSTTGTDPYGKVGTWREDHGLPFVPSTPPDYPQDGAKETAKKVAEKKAGTKTDKSGVKTATSLEVEKEVRGETYKVASGDTLSGIASKLYPGKAKNGLKALLEANKNIDPNKMKVGQTLKVPALAAEKADVKVAKLSKESESETKPDHMTMGEKEEHAKDVAGKKTSASSGDVYEVASGDTLEKIASKLYHDRSRWQEIFDLNKDKLSSPGSIRVGQKLKIKGTEAAEAKTEKTDKSTTGKKKSTTVAQADLNGIEGVSVIGGDTKPVETTSVKPVKDTGKHEVSSAATVWMP